MTDPVQENLLGLLLGALDDAERRDLEERLETDAELRARFRELQAKVEPLNQGRMIYEPPAGLADRTFAFVQREVALREVGSQRGKKLSPQPEASEKRASWSWYDMLVGTSVIAALFTLIMPGILASWESANRAFCERNLTTLGLALHDFAAQQPDQRLPQIPYEGNQSFAGVYAPILFHMGYLNKPSVIVCPSSEFASGQVVVRMPTLEEIDSADAVALSRLQRLSGGSYGYNLGYMRNGKYVSPSLKHATPYFVWAADAPAWNVAGRFSENHHGRGQNMLFADQHVAFATSGLRPNGDDVYRNDRGLVAAGLDVRDSVIGGGQDRPFLQPASYRER